MEMGMPASIQKVCELSDDTKLTCIDIISVITVLLLYMVSFLSIICFLLAIIARVKNLNHTKSILFFGSIGKMSFPNYKDRVKQLTEQEIMQSISLLIT